MNNTLAQSINTLWYFGPLVAHHSVLGGVFDQLRSKLRSAGINRPRIRMGDGEYHFNS